MRILLADSNHHILHETLTAAGFQCDLFWDKTVEELKSILPQYEGLVIRSRFKLSADVLAQCKKMKCIGRVGAGMENIDVEYARKKNIVCVSAPEGNRDAVGEHALGMILMLLNKLNTADLEVRDGIWLRAENRGIEIKGKTIGIIGFGNMGSTFAKKLAGFECEILAYDKYKKGFGNEGVKEAELQELFDKCDLLSLHVPLTEETMRMVNDAFINKFKKPFFLVNTARGQVVKTDDLVEALKKEKVLGACLDVLEYEDLSFEKLNREQLPAAFSYLIDSTKVVLSPHIAGWTHESHYKMSKIIAEKMIEVLKS